jgi:nicotinamidase/pyrazinamidase
MNARLLIIDPQNDFCDIAGAALPVPGANADMQRLAAFMNSARARLTDVIITLDSHASVGIERTTFWATGDGKQVQPFTQISEQDVREGRFRPRDTSRKQEVTEYLHALERGGRYQLMVWPVHCVLGTWGHNIHSEVADEVARWEEHAQRSAFRVLKGMNPMTEQYSAIQAEVPSATDPQTQTNDQLLTRARPSDGMLFVAGEAASHCVAATLEHMFEDMSSEQRRRVVVLRDCMSPVAGFEQSATAFFDSASGQGARVMTSSEVLKQLLV